MAVAARGGDVAGVIFHSDRGSEICRSATPNASPRSALQPRSGLAGTATTTPRAESFFSTLEWELFRTTHFATRQVARRKSPATSTGTTGSAGTARATGSHRSNTRRSSPPGRPRTSRPRRRRENRPPRSRQSTTTRSGGPDTGAMTGSIDYQRPSTIRGEAHGCRGSELARRAQASGSREGTLVDDANRAR
jgi:hypothetical protein